MAKLSFVDASAFLMTLAEKLNEFYIRYNIPLNGGENDKTFDVPLPFFTLTLPNLSWRKKMLHVHDLEHILNEQDTSWQGEIFIASWEISTGLWRNFPICIFPLWAMGWGLWIHPMAVLSGFRKGAADKGIAALSIPQNEILQLSLEQLRALTIGKANKKPAIINALKLFVFGFIGQVLFLLPLLMMLFLGFLLF